jgi:HlyD family secretion protein
MVLKAEGLPAAGVQKRSLTDLIAREKRRRRTRIGVVWSTLIALAACAGLAWYALRPKPIPLAARFRSQTVSHGDLVREVRATGHLEAVTTVQVGAEISGRLASVEVQYNDRVQAGQVLARFDRAALAAQLAQIEATLAAARAGLQQARTEVARLAASKARTDRLFASGSIPQSEHDDLTSAFALAQQRAAAAEAEVAAQVAAQQLARTTLDHTVVRSPIDGIVITRNVDPGQTVASALQAPVLFTVAADLRKMRVVAAVDEADIGEVVVGQRAEFAVTAYPTRTFGGTVIQVRNSPQIIQDVVTYGAEIDVANIDLALKPGMTATARIRTGSAQDVLTVPAMALQFTPPGEKARSSTVWVLREGSLYSVEVEAGLSNGEVTAVESVRLTPGLAVLTELTPEGRKSYGIAR